MLDLVELCQYKRDCEDVGDMILILRVKVILRLGHMVKVKHVVNYYLVNGVVRNDLLGVEIDAQKQL